MSVSAQEHSFGGQQDALQGKTKQIFKFNPKNRKVPPMMDECINLVTKCLIDHDTESAEMWLDIIHRELPTFNNRTFFNSLIHACAKSGSHDAAAWCAVRMVQDGLSPNLVTFNSMINACAKVGKIDLATQWLDMMSQLGLKPNTITYNTMISACAQARDARNAEWWMLKMINDKVTPCKFSFSSVIDALAKNAKLDRAEKWLSRMLEAGITPDAVVYNSLINGCAKAVNPSKAEYWILQMRINNLEPDAKTYNSLIHAFAKAGQIERAEHWFERMERAGCSADNITFGTVIHASAKTGNVDRAEYWLEEMMRRGVPPNLVCFNTLLHACAHNGDTERAQAWFVKVMEAGFVPNKITYNSMIHAYAKAGNAATAQAWLQEMVANGCHPDNITYITLLGVHSRTMQGMDPNDRSSHTCGYIIKAYAEAGNATCMKRWLSEMVRAGCAPSRELCEEILHACSKHGNPSLQANVEKMLSQYQKGSIRGKPMNNEKQKHPNGKESLRAPIKAGVQSEAAQMWKAEGWLRHDGESGACCGQQHVMPSKEEISGIAITPFHDFSGQANEPTYCRAIASAPNMLQYRDLLKSMASTSCILKGEVYIEHISL